VNPEPIIKTKENFMISERRRIQIFLAPALLIWLAFPGHAESSKAGNPRDMGIGVAVGQPTGVAGKLWLDKNLAVDAFAGYHFSGDFDLHGDLLYHAFSILPIEHGRLPLYFGLGGRVLLGDDDQFGLRVPIGVSFLFPDNPIEVFGELAPVMKVTSGVAAYMDFLVGARVYINYLK
jgi:hypothetical protein